LIKKFVELLDKSAINLNYFALYLFGTLSEKTVDSIWIFFDFTI